MKTPKESLFPTKIDDIQDFPTLREFLKALIERMEEEHTGLYEDLKTGKDADKVDGIHAMGCVSTPEFLDIKTKGPWVDVRAYGAKGDGSDATAQIQGAINENGNGGIIFIPKGSYGLSQTLTMKSNQILIGEGAKISILNFISTTANGITLDTEARNCQVLNLKLCAINNSTGAGIDGTSGIIRELNVNNYEIEGFLNGIKIYGGMNPFIGQGRLIGQGKAIANGNGILFGNYATSKTVNTGIIRNSYVSSYKTGINFDRAESNTILGGAIETTDIAIKNRGFNACYGTWLGADTYFLQQATGGWGFILSSPSMFANSTTRKEAPNYSGMINFGDSDSQNRTVIIGHYESFPSMYFTNRGDPPAYDFTSFTTNGAWQDLDLSGIVPIGATRILIKVYVTDDVAGSVIEFRKNGSANTVVDAVAREYVANIPHYYDLIVPCDSNRIIEYLATNTTFTSLGLTVKGWWR